MENKLKAGDRVTVSRLTFLDKEMGLRIGMEADVLDVSPSHISAKVKIADWKHPSRPLFDEGERHMLCNQLTLKL